MHSVMLEICNCSAVNYTFGQFISVNRWSATYSMYWHINRQFIPIKSTGSASVKYSWNQTLSDNLTPWYFSKIRKSEDNNSKSKPAQCWLHLLRFQKFAHCLAASSNSSASGMQNRDGGPVKVTMNSHKTA